MKKQRLRFIIVGLLLLTAIWLVWPEEVSSPDDPNHATNTQQPSPKRFGWHLLGFGQNTNQTRPANRAQSTEESALDRIDSLIDHQTLTDHEVAEQLRVIAEDKRIPESARAEALGHGVILDLPVFVDMAADTQLPEEMAEDLLEHVINANEDPALQIRAYTNFLNHESEEIREDAMELLAFMLQDDAGEADQATLLKMADAKLKQLEIEKLEAGPIEDEPLQEE